MNRGLAIALVGAVALAALALFGGRRELPVEKLRHYIDKDSDFLELRGMKVHYKDEGVAASEPGLVLLHGTGSSLHTWDGWVAELSPHHRIIRMDLPGFGLTGPDLEGRYTPDDDIEFLDAFFDALGLESIALAGNSLGGGIALRYALERPNRVARLILIDSSGLPHPPIRMLELVKVPGLGALLQRFAPPGATRRMLEEIYGDAEVGQDVVTRYHELSRRQGNRAALRDRRRASRPSLAGRLAEIRVPTLILWGSRDPWIPEANACAFRDGIQGARLIKYPDLGHVPMEEDPERTARDAHAFLAGSSEPEEVSGDS